MPEIPKWLIALIVIIAGCWVISQAVDFFGKVNTTVNKANQSIERDATSLQNLNE